MSFLSLIFLYLKKKVKSRDPGISRDGDQFCPVIPGYGKASEILNPNGYTLHNFRHKFRDDPRKKWKIEPPYCIAYIILYYVCLLYCIANNRQIFNNIPWKLKRKTIPLYSTHKNNTRRHKDEKRRRRVKDEWKTKVIANERSESSSYQSIKNFQ